MDVKELRIGNLITWTVDIFKRPHEIMAQDLVDIENGLPKGVEILPIELTPKWKIKLGFHENGEPTSRLKIDCDYGIVTVNLDENLHVHKLQNLWYALTGQELTIKQPESV